MSTLRTIAVTKKDLIDVHTVIRLYWARDIWQIINLDHGPIDKTLAIMGVNDTYDDLVGPLTTLIAGFKTADEKGYLILVPSLFNRFERVLDQDPTEADMPMLPVSHYAEHVLPLLPALHRIRVAFTEAGVVTREELMRPSRVNSIASGFKN